jgi:hypothetical protein
MIEIYYNSTHKFGKVCGISAKMFVVLVKRNPSDRSVAEKVPARAGLPSNLTINCQ